MDPQLPLDPSRDPFQAFASETPIAPTHDLDPAFLRAPAGCDSYLSITSIAEQPPVEPSRIRLVAAVFVVVGVLAGFAGGYWFAHRVIAAAPGSTLVVAPPPPTPAQRSNSINEPPRDSSTITPVPREPTRGFATIQPAAAPPETSTTQRSRPGAGSPRHPSLIAPVQSADATVMFAPSTPPSTTRPSAIERLRPAPTPITSRAGVIEVLSRPPGGQVLLDGNMVGHAPLSIPDVSEGTHEVRVELDGFSPWVASVRVKDGIRARVGASLEP